MDHRSLRIDALRGIAIVLVMQLHMLVSTQAFREMHIPDPMIQALSYGWAGVVMFFVMSAYLLTSVLLRHRGEDNLTGVFYLRRALRILPLYWILLIAGSLARAWWRRSGGDPLFWLWENQPPMATYVLFLQNWIMGWIGRPVAAFYAVTWSLAVEEHFYLFLPLLVARLSPRGLGVLAATFIFMGPIIRFSLSIAPGPLAAYTWTIAHLDSFGWGMLLALARQFRPNLLETISAKFSAFVAFGLLVFASFAAPEMLNFKDSATGVTFASLAGMFALIAAIQPSNVPEKNPGLTIRCLAWCGKRCYSLYLIHGPVIGMTFVAAGWPNPPTAANGGLPFILLAVATTFVLAAITHRYIEQPLMALADRIAPYAPTP